MRRKVLDSLVARGSLVGIVASENSRIQEDLSAFARSLCGEARFSFQEFSARSGGAVDFLHRSREALKAGNLRCLFIVFRGTLSGEALKLLGSMRMAIVLADASGNFPDGETLSELEALSPYPSGFFWWISGLPDKKRFPKLFREAKKSYGEKWNSASDVKSFPADAAKRFTTLLECKILSENRLEGFSRVFRRVFLPLCAAVAVLPFLWPLDLASHPLPFRSVKSELSVYAAAPYFDYVFGGSETLERIARYAVGRFAAVVTTDSLLQDYIAETLDKNGFAPDSWKKGGLHVPPEGTSIRFSIPERIENPAYDSIAPAWKYFTGILSDSVSYVTELYHPTATAEHRLHPAWDVAGRFGTRILSPFSGKAWTFKDNRGGIVIGISDGTRVILFMHCDQLFYLNGQNVMQGDPVATVGMSGHSTGPHVHIVTGRVDKRGKKRLGNMRYSVVNPVTWFLESK